MQQQQGISLSPFNNVFPSHFLLVFRGIMTDQETQSHWYHYSKILQMKHALLFITTSAKQSERNTLLEGSEQTSRFLCY